MKKIFIFFILLFIPFIVNGLELPVDVTATGVALYDLTDERMIYGKNENDEVILASLTKMMTLYIAINENTNYNQKVKLDEADFKGLEVYTKAGLQIGDVVTLNDLFYCTNLPSGAECALALANITSGNKDKFVELMNEYAKKLGLEHTRFEDPMGGETGNVSTPKEWIEFTKICLENKLFKKVFSTNGYKLSNGLYVVNYTKPISTYYGFDYKVITGNKAGYTDEAGLLLDSTATINGIDYILVVCNSKVEHIANEGNHIKDTYAIYNYIKDKEYKERVIIKKGDYIGTIKVTNSTIDEYILNSDRDISIVLNDDEYEKINYDYQIIDTISGETKRGSKLGRVDFYIGDELIYTYEFTLRDYIFTKREGKIMEYSAYGLLSLAVLLLFFYNVKKKKK